MPLAINYKTPFPFPQPRQCDGVCNKSDYKLLTSRNLRGQGPPNDEEWTMGPVLVTNNGAKDAKNRKAAEAYAERTGRPLGWYHAVDMHQKKVVNDPALVEKLEGIHSGQTIHR